MYVTLAAAPAPLVALAVLAAYLLGTFPSAQLAGRWRGIDPTATGSRNPGATNVLRTAGRWAGIVTLLADIAKGAAAAAAGWAAGGHALGVACGTAAVVGHVAPATRRFRGGKGVATGLGMLVVLFPGAALAGSAGFVAVFAATRIAAVGSLVGMLLALAVAVLPGPPAVEIAGLTLCAAVVLGRHAGNLGRLLRGQERPTGLR